MTRASNDALGRMPSSSLARSFLVALAALALAPGCKRGGGQDPGSAPAPSSSTAAPGGTPVVIEPGPAAPVVLPITRRWPDRRTPCERPPFTPASWSHRRSSLAAASGQPRHVAADTIIAAGATPRLDGKFAYGAVSKDLEDELIRAYVASGDCAAVAIEPARTDDDGRVRVAGPALAPGHHHFWLIAAGDGSHAEAGAWVVPSATPAVLFDVDGTLTTDDGELFDDLLGGTATAFDGAAAVARRWAEKGYLIVYVTGRPYPLREHTRRWLEAGGFPYGPLFTPDRMREARPTRAGVGAYKRELLVDLQARGVTFARAYGNAATDVCAYVQANIAPSITYIVGNRAGCDGRPAPHPLASYVEHLADVDMQPDAP